MNVWKLASANRLERAELPTPASDDPEQIRVRITKVLLNGLDVALYHGRIKAKYPLIPGRFAIGTIMDETKNLLFPKGARVLLHAFRPAQYEGTAKLGFEEDDYLVCGHTCDGFLREFALVPPDCMTPLPDSVGDEGALAVHYVALARACLDKLDVRRGQHIAVIGANPLGIVICQLLIYQQASPILIDTEPSRLEFARRCGVYYTIPADDALMESVGGITGGRLVSGAVYVMSAAGNERSLAFRVCAREATVVIGGLFAGNMQFDLEPALKKQIPVHCVWNSASYLENALNLIATHAVDLSGFRNVSVEQKALPEFYEHYDADVESNLRQFCIVNMI